MEQKRAGFFFYRAIFDSVSQLKKREKAIIYDAIFAYALDMKEPNTEGWSDTARAIWTLAKPMLDNDLRRFENGCKGGAPRGNSNAKKSEAEKTTEKQPKNNQKQPTILQEQEQEQDTSTRIENNTSLSLSPSSEVEPREVADGSAEREKILEIFFFKNFLNPLEEVDRFYAHYEAQGWKRSGGAAITDRVALAQSWQPKNEAKRFTIDILALLAKWYNVGTPELRHLLLTELVEAKADESMVRLRLYDGLRQAIESNAERLQPSFAQNFAGHRLGYSVIQPC